jgi:hypothetical protein
VLPGGQFPDFGTDGTLVNFGEGNRSLLLVRHRLVVSTEPMQKVGHVIVQGSHSV